MLTLWITWFKYCISVAIICTPRDQLSAAMLKYSLKWRSVIWLWPTSYRRIPTISIIHVSSFALQKAELEKIAAKCLRYQLPLWVFKWYTLMRWLPLARTLQLHCDSVLVPSLFTMSGSPRWAHSVLEALKCWLCPPYYNVTGATQNH